MPSRSHVSLSSSVAEQSQSSVPPVAAAPPKDRVIEKKNRNARHNCRSGCFDLRRIRVSSKVVRYKNAVVLNEIAKGGHTRRRQEGIHGQSRSVNSMSATAAEVDIGKRTYLLSITSILLCRQLFIFLFLLPEHDLVAPAIKSVPAILPV